MNILDSEVRDFNNLYNLKAPSTLRSGPHALHSYNYALVSYLQRR